jgi:hypothetical protein
MLRRVSLLFVAGLALVSFGPLIWTEAVHRLEIVCESIVESRAARPPASLPIRAEDFDRYPITGFGFSIEDRSGIGFDSDRGTLRFRGPTGTDTSVALILSEHELDAIYRKAIAIRLFEFPEPYPPVRPDHRMAMESRTYEVPSVGSLRRSTHPSSMDRDAADEKSVGPVEAPR